MDEQTRQALDRVAYRAVAVAEAVTSVEARTVSRDVAIVTARALGATLREIAEAAKVNHQTVQNILNRAVVPEGVDL